MKYCTHCGNQVDDECIICPKCGCYADKKSTPKEIFNEDDPNASGKSRLVDFLLCLFIGLIGAHCFYEGKIGKGVLYIFTAGLFFIGIFVDFVKIITGTAKDKSGLPIKNWNMN